MSFSPSSIRSISPVQRLVLALGSSYVALANPWRADMVAVCSEVTSDTALKHMLAQMRRCDEGKKILLDRPQLSKQDAPVLLDRLMAMPEGSLGHSYATYCKIYKISPDSRLPVEFVPDAEEAYVLQRYRDIHDVTHALLAMPTNRMGETVVKWVEGLMYGLPMCVGAAILAPVNLGPKQTRQFHLLRPWAIQTGLNASFLLNVYFEERWEQNVEELRQELNIQMPPNYKDV